MLQHNVPIGTAASTYTVMTIGDGLVSQIPALIISIAAGLLVSKAGVEGSADKALVSDAPLQLEMRDTLREVGKAATAVRNLADLLERQPEALLTGKKGE